MGETVGISSATRGAMLDHARTAAPEEACGLLFGVSKGAIEGHIPCKNSALYPKHEFEISPLVLLAAQRECRAAGQIIVGHYHSHPSGSARPSPRDREQAFEDGRLWLIVSGDQISAWRPKQGQFEEVCLDTVI